MTVAVVPRHLSDIAQAHTAEEILSIILESFADLRQEQDPNFYNIDESNLHIYQHGQRNGVEIAIRTLYQAFNNAGIYYLNRFEPDRSTDAANH